MPAGHDAVGVTERFTRRHDQCGRAGAGYVRRCNTGNMIECRRDEASSSVKIYAPELHEAFILGALLRGGYRPFETIFLGGMAEAGAGWRWSVTGPAGRDGFRDNAAWTGGLKGRGSRSLKQWRMT